VKDPMLMDNEEFAEFIKDMQPEYADAWTVMRFESLVNQLMQKFMNPEKKYGKQVL
jgi:wyosine [tRNA(Phe)-imidazoG37] synthetase (radical SAM superfamily)